ncbi:MAG: CFI-box-CTERM domain-containing protein, partial [Candidatus Methylomirabilales bacterium]
DTADYFVQVTAVDVNGNESSCSNSVSGFMKTDTSASLAVRTLEGTRIFLNGNYSYPGSFQGVVPSSGELRITGLPSGMQVVRASMARFVDAVRPVMLAPDENALSLNLALFDPRAFLSPTLTALQAGAPIRGGGDAAAPFVVDWDNDGKKDLLVAGGDGKIALYRNVRSDTTPQFSGSAPIMADGTPIAVPGPAFAFVVDWDSDGGKDLVVGDGQGHVRWYRNTLADAAPQLANQGFIQAGGVQIQVNRSAAPIVVDWNNDGKKDLLVGDGGGIVRVFLNQGTDNNAVLGPAVEVSLPNVGVNRINARPFVVDWNQDGRKDLLVGDENGEVYLFLNSGTDDAPAFTTGATLTGESTPTSLKVNSNATPFVVDWNNDSLRDLVIGENQGQVFLAQGAQPAAPSGGAGGGGGGGCFIATAAYGSSLAPQVQLLRELRDRYLLPHRPGRTLVTLYYRLSPPLADVIARSEILRAIVRAGLVPIFGWAALVLWSPGVGLGVLLGALTLGTWRACLTARRHGSGGTGPAIPPIGRDSRAGPPARSRRLTLWGSAVFVLAASSLLGAGSGGWPQAEARVEVVAEVRLPQATRFALIRDPETGQVDLYKDGDPIFEGQEPLPLGKILAVHDHSLVLVLPRGRVLEIPKGTRLPGPRRLIFVRSTMLDTLRFQVRSGAGASAHPDYTVVEIAGRRALLERDIQSVPGGLPSAVQRVPLAELVNRGPFVEVAPDTWQVPERAVKQIGDQLGPLVTEVLGSATPSITAGYGLALRMDTSLGSGTLDRRGFLIQYSKLARRMGLEVGDRILFVNEYPVNSLGGLVIIYRRLKSDSGLSEVKVVINRRHQLRTLTYRIR